MSMLCIKDMRHADRPPSHYDIMFFYLVWSALLQEMYGYCYINKQFIHFATDQSSALCIRDASSMNAQFADGLAMSHFWPVQLQEI
jgi:hypothetical protein